MTNEASIPAPDTGAESLLGEFIDGPADEFSRPVQSPCVADVAAMFREFGDQLASMSPGPRAESTTLSPILCAEGPGAEQLLRLMLGVSDQVEGYLALLVSVLDQDGLWALRGAKDFLAYLTDHVKVPFGRAKKLSQLGDGLRDHLAETAQALCTGQVSLANAQAIVETMTASQDRINSLSQPDPDHPRTGQSPAAGITAQTEDGGISAESAGGTAGNTSGDTMLGDHSNTGGDTMLGDHSDTSAAGPQMPDPTPPVNPPPTGEQVLLARAANAKPKVFRDMLDGRARRIDPVVDERSAADLYASQSFEIVRRRGGGYAVKGDLDDEAGLTLRTVLAALIKQLPEQTRRTTERGHQQALALHMLARLDLERVLTTTKSGAQLHLNVAVDHDTFVRAATSAGVPDADLPRASALNPARWVDSRGPIADSTLERMACDSKVARIIFGPDSQILNAGDEIRIASAHQRRAVIARDTHCVFPNCTAPPGLCEVHHLDEWVEDGGPTDIENLALICWHHHHHIHGQRLKLTRDKDQKWKILRRDRARIPNRC